MKKIILLAIVLSLSLSGCFLLNKQDMAELAKDNTYHYQNKDLGFSVNLPSQFQYYQVQRKQVPDFTDVEIFVPTNDAVYPQEVPSYAKPVVVRIYNRDFWNTIGDDRDEKKLYQKTGEKGDRIYTIRFWEKIPADWGGRWNDDMKDKILKSFRVK